MIFIVDLAQNVVFHVKDLGIGDCATRCISMLSIAFPSLIVE